MPRVAPQPGQALGQGPEHLLPLDPGQRGPKTMMHALAERYMRVRIAGDVEPVRIGEHLGIAVGGGDRPTDPVLLPDQLASHLNVLSRDPLG